MGVTCGPSRAPSSWVPGEGASRLEQRLGSAPPAPLSPSQIVSFFFSLKNEKKSGVSGFREPEPRPRRAPWGRGLTLPCAVVAPNRVGMEMRRWLQNPSRRGQDNGPSGPHRTLPRLGLPCRFAEEGRNRARSTARAARAGTPPPPPAPRRTASGSAAPPRPGSFPAAPTPSPFRLPGGLRTPPQLGPSQKAPDAFTSCHSCLVSKNRCSR